jgi:hypothetical protein
VRLGAGVMQEEAFAVHPLTCASGWMGNSSIRADG